MKCDKVVEKYLKLDEVSRIPFILRLHIIFCRGCRKEIFRLKKAFLFIRNDSLYKTSFDMSCSVMDIIRSERKFIVKTVSGLKWVTIGSLIFFSILLVNFSDSFLWLKNEFGSDYTLPMSLVMGFVFTAYATILVGCNYEYIKKYIDLHSKWKLK